jgi:hypothetical protein
MILFAVAVAVLLNQGPERAAPDLEARPEFKAAQAATQKGQLASALLDYETLYDSTGTDEPTRAALRIKFAELRPQVAPNPDPRKAGTWKVEAFAFRELDFAWTDPHGTNHHAHHRYRADEIDRLHRSMAGFAERVWKYTDGQLRIDWQLKVIDKPLTRLDGESTFWPGPAACMPYLTGLCGGDADTLMVFAKAWGDPQKGETSEGVPEMLLGGALGASELTQNATYIGFNWGSGAVENEPEGEPMLHEWLHSAQWTLEDYQGYPRGLMFTSDGGKMEGDTGGDPCYRRKPSEPSWMGFYQHLMRDHVTRRMWRELTLRRPPRNVWVNPSLFILGAALVGGEAPPQTDVALHEGRWIVNGRPTNPGSAAEGLLMNVRMVNAVFEDRNRPDFDPEANTDRFIARLPEYAAQGVNAFTICMQGGMPGYEGALNSAFDPEGGLRPAYLERVERVIHACDRNGMVVILGLYYQRQSKVLRDESAVRAGVVNAARWIVSRGFRNVLVEVANEYPHSGFAHALIRDPKGQASLVRLVKDTAPGLLVTASGYGDGKVHAEVAEACDFLTPHWNGTKVEDIPARVAGLKRFGKPIVCNEDDKVGQQAVAALRASVVNGCGYGLMLKDHNQTFPFRFDGAADDPDYYAALRLITSTGAPTATPIPRPPVEWTVASPNRAVRATILLDEHSGAASYRVSSRGLTVIEQSPMGIATSVGDFTGGLAPVNDTLQEIRETYVLPVGKRSTYLNHANELILTLRKNPGTVRLRFRAYDDGIAFSYVLDGTGPVAIFGETSGFRLPADGGVTYWGQNHPNNYGYETLLGRVEGERMSIPVLAELKELKHFLFLAQAASYGTYIVPHFQRHERQLNLRFPLDQEGPVETTLPFQSPWRLAIVSPDTLATLVESTLLENLNPPTEPELHNADWIKPGRASWDFLAGDRDKPQAWIDFDVAMGWEYHLVDAGFERRFDVAAATRYARERNVRMIGWGYTPDLNSREKAEAILSRYAGMGLSGAKLDFFDHHPFTGNKRTQDFEDTQASLKMRDDLMEIAAKQRLVLEFHGCTLPSGERRRYPHFMTAEAVAGMEKRNPKIENELTIPFVRNIMGPVSFTVIKFDRSLGSHAYQMAQAVVYEAGLQIYAEHHDRLRNFAGVDFLKKIPAAWDETRFLDGYPGSHAVVARRKTQTWFVGGLTDQPRTARVSLGFLENDRPYQAQLYRDGAAKTNLVIEAKSVTRDSCLEIRMLQNGGFAISLEPSRPQEQDRVAVPPPPSQPP